MTPHGFNLEIVPHASATTLEQHSLVAISQVEPRQLGVRGRASTLLATESSEEQGLTLLEPPSSVPRELTSREAAHTKTRGKVLAQKQVEHRAAHKQKKQTLRRKRILRDADEAQDEELTKVSPCNALPDFEYLEIAEPLETPSGLAAFGTLGFFSDQTMTDPPPSLPTSNQLPTDPPVNNNNNNNNNNTYPSDWEVSAAAVGTLRHIGDNSVNNLNSGISSSSLNQQALTAASHPPINASQALRDVSQVSMDQLPCYCPTCPITKFHTIGPYYHNGVLGDQDHAHFKGTNPPPEVWLAYERSLRGIASYEEVEILQGFWLWHVYVFPEL